MVKEFAKGIRIDPKGSTKSGEMASSEPAQAATRLLKQTIPIHKNFTSVGRKA
jgi:hypothetical protein